MRVCVFMLCSQTGDNKDTDTQSYVWDVIGNPSSGADFNVMKEQNFIEIDFFLISVSLKVPGSVSFGCSTLCTISYNSSPFTHKQAQTRLQRKIFSLVAVALPL